MLETIFRTPGERKQAETELRDLVAEVREQRQALRVEHEEFSAQIERANSAAAKLARANKALDELNAKADAAMRKVDGLAEVAASYDERARRLEKLDQRVGALTAQLSEAEKSTKTLMGPGSLLQTHRQGLDELLAQAREAQAALAGVRQDNGALAQEHTQMRKATDELRQALQGLSGFERRLDELHQAEEVLRRDVDGSREVASRARAEALTAAEAAKEVAARFDSLTQLQELSKDTEKRIASLHALTEHVSLKTKAMETQRHMVDNATAETARLNQMVWAMEAQITKLAEGQERMLHAEQAVARIEQLAQTATQDLAAATAAREEFTREMARVEGQGRGLLDSLRAMTERLTVAKEEYRAFDERVESLSGALAGAETRMQAVLASDETYATMLHKAEGLSKVFGDLRGEAEELARKQVALDQLTEQLSLVETQGRRTAAQHESLKRAQSDFEAMRAELVELQKSHADLARMRDGMAQHRSALEAFVERTGAMMGRTPEIETRLDAVLSKMNLLEEGQSAAKRLGEAAGALDAELTRVGARMQFVDGVGERINALFSTSAEVERKLAELAARRTEIDAMAEQCRSLGAQIALAHQQLDGVSQQQARLLPLAAEVTRLDEALQGTQRAVAAVRQGEAAALQQQAQLANLVQEGTVQAAQTAEQLRQVRALSDSLAKVSGRSEEVLAELAQVQARQRDALAQVSLTEEQLRQADAMLRQIDQRRTLLVHTEKSLSGFEARLADLDHLAMGVDSKMKSLSEREASVQAVKAEVDGVRQLAGRSKADLQFVAEHRHELADLRGKVDELLSRVGDADGHIALIETWRKKVEEVQSNAHAVNVMLSDVQGTLENLSEQRVVIDDVGEKLARLDFTVQEAQSTLTRLDASAQESQSTLRTLQREREVAERVAASIKTLRARGTNPVA